MEIRDWSVEETGTVESGGNGPAASSQFQWIGPLGKTVGLHGLPRRRIARVHEDFNWTAWQTHMPTVQEANEHRQHQEAET